MRQQIVLAVRIPRTKDFDDAGQTKKLEEESYMRVGRKKYKMTGHFPPTQNDVYLRMAFRGRCRRAINRLSSNCICRA